MVKAIRIHGNSTRAGGNDTHRGANAIRLSYEKGYKSGTLQVVDILFSVFISVFDIGRFTNDEKSSASLFNVHVGQHVGCPDYRSFLNRSLMLLPS